MQISRIISVGLAIFTMLFGAGNVVFPLSLGREMGSQVIFALMGLVLTGVLVPVLGLVSASLFDGDYKKFLGTAGRIPAFLLALVAMLLLGPFGATPRCITLAHAAIGWYVPGLNLFVFSILVAIIVYLATIKRSAIVDIFGRFLGPIKCMLLFSIVILGLLSSAQAPHVAIPAWVSFAKGFNEGFLTLDLMATIFFSGLIINSIKHKFGGSLTSKGIVVFALKAGLIGGSLLGLVYAGFCILAAKYGLFVSHLETEQLLSGLATLVLGQHAGILANITMAVACLTTAIALTAVFADYLKHVLLFGRIKYAYALLLTVVANFVMTNLGFAGLARIIEPMAVICYPALIVLSLANIAYALVGFKYVKPLVFLTFALTIVLKFAS